MSKYLDLVGQKFNKLTLLEVIYTPEKPRKYEFGLFECECGNKKKIQITGVVNNRVKSCGCIRKSMYTNRDDEVLNKKIGSIYVVIVYRKPGFKNGYAECVCDCGKTCEKNIRELKKNKYLGCSFSCSLNNSGKRLGENNSSWKGYKKISAQILEHYKRGAFRRGITFSDKITPKYLWELLESQDFKCVFTGDLLEIYSTWDFKKNNLSLDRIDSSKGYEIGNLQWVLKDINIIKKNYSDKEFIKLCTKIVDYQNKKGTVYDS